MSHESKQLLARIENLEADIRTYRAEHHALSHFTFTIFKTLSADQRTQTSNDLQRILSLYDRRPADIKDDSEDFEAHLARLYFAAFSEPPPL